MIKGVYSLECIQWTSSRDGKYRSHCYEYLQETRNSTFEAEATCKMSGGQLAPFVDEFQFNFWRDFLPTVRYKIFFKCSENINTSVEKHVYCTVPKLHKIVNYFY